MLSWGLSCVQLGIVKTSNFNQTLLPEYLINVIPLAAASQEKLFARSPFFFWRPICLSAMCCVGTAVVFLSSGGWFLALQMKNPGLLSPAGTEHCVVSVFLKL